MPFDTLDDIGAFGWRAALACHIGMATFSEAGVSGAGA